MTENRRERRSPVGRTNWLAMSLAVIMVAAFMVWLGANSAPSTASVVEETEEEVATVVPATVEELDTSAEAYMGQVVRVAGVEVVSRLGARAFWIGLPSGTPFLAMMADDLAAAGVSVAPGDTLLVVGTVKARTDEILAAWDAAGVFEDEGQRMQAEFATVFIEVSSLERLGGAGE